MVPTYSTAITASRRHRSSRPALPRLSTHRLHPGSPATQGWLRPDAHRQGWTHSARRKTDDGRALVHLDTSPLEEVSAPWCERHVCCKPEKPELGSASKSIVLSRCAQQHVAREGATRV